MIIMLFEICPDSSNWLYSTRFKVQHNQKGYIMSKKGKRLLNLSAVAIVVAIGAQFYTNYKIDQTLKDFPYHFNHQFTINVEERNSDFFTRDLVFSLQQDGEKSDFIHTELTALPFAIQANSYLTADIIKTLNQQLNITIDKHNISSQFAVFTNELQSVVNMEFRDTTNTTQTLETDIRYSTANKSIKLNTQLSGWNTEHAKLKEIHSEYTLHPIMNSEYELVNAKLNILHTDINLLDGEDTHIELHKGKYELNKKINEKDYDFTLSLFNDNVNIHNKQMKEQDSHIHLNGISFSTKQKAIPTEFNFAQQIEQLNLHHFSTDKTAQLIMDILFNNEEFNTSFGLKELDFKLQDQLINLTDTEFDVTAQHKVKEKSSLQVKGKSGNLNIQSTETKQPVDFTLKDLSFHVNMSEIDLVKEIDFIKTYFPKNWHLSHAEKDNKAFIEALNMLAKEYQTKTESAVNIGEVSVKNAFSLHQFAAKYQDEFKDNQWHTQTNFTLDKIALIEPAMQLTEVKIQLPITLSPKEEVIKSSLCTQHIYALFCLNHLSEKTYYEQEENFLKKLAMNIQDATTEGLLDSLPASNNAQKITMNINADVAEEGNILAKLFQANVNINLNIPTALFNEMKEDNPKAKIKQNNPYWQDFYQFIERNGQKEADHYILNYQLQEGVATFNGKELEDENDYEEELLEEEMEEEIENDVTIDLDDK